MGVRGRCPPKDIMASVTSMAARSLVFGQEVTNLPEDFGAWLQVQSLVDVSTRAYLYDEIDEDLLLSRLSDTLKGAGASN